MKKSEEILKLKEHQRQLKAREIDLRQTHETSMLESTVLKLQTEMEQCQSELEQARGKLSEVQREKEKEMRSLQLQNEQGTKKHRSMITDCEKLKGSLALKEEEVNKLSKELHKQSSQSDDLRLASASKEKEIARLRVSHTEELKKIRDLHKRMMAESKRKNKMDAEKAAEKIIKLEKQLLGCIKSSHLGDCTNEHLGLKGKQEIEQRIEGPRQRKKEKDAVLIDDKDGSQVKIRNSSQHPVDKELLSTSHLTGSLEKKHHKVVGSSSRQHPSRRKLDQRKFSIFFLLWYTFLGGCGSGQQSPHMDQQESITVIMMALTWSCIHLL
uniref:Cilia- and flagella-associated protein 157 n=1 Tax=Heterosigma akashiwo TaxID=2829 RepID=A0A7S3XII9_HETAK